MLNTLISSFFWLKVNIDIAPDNKISLLLPDMEKITDKLHLKIDKRFIVMPEANILYCLSHKFKCYLISFLWD
jgi:hypothetical protein